MNVDKYFEDLDSPMREIAYKLRGIVKDLSPDMVEEIKWGVPTYTLGRSFCSVMAHKKHVNLQIFQGAQIKDAGELVGTGKNMRHLSYQAVSEIEEKAVRKYLKQALQLIIVNQ